MKGGILFSGALQYSLGFTQWVPHRQTSVTYRTYKDVSPLSEYLSRVGISISSSFGRKTFKHQRTTCHRTKVKDNTGCTGAEYTIHDETPASHIWSDFNQF
jgi:hypothetical protein